ncbi:MAG: aspartate aminotransferase family protein [Burkholderiales bacterium]|nr:aspartate aminotransferase family protein [Burkholderiales bacterium]
MTQYASSLRQLLSPGVKTFAVDDEPPLFVRGHGATLEDEAGSNYIDMASGSSVMHLGYGNEAVVAAIRRQIETGLLHIGPHFHTPSQVEFLSEIKAILPPGLERLHPATNGTEAIEVAIKLCQYATGKRRFLSFQGSYHGRTAGSLAISAARGKAEVLGPFLPAVLVLPYPDSQESDCATNVQSVLDALGSLSYGQHELAGIFVEPIQGTGGMVVPPRGFLSVVADRARALGIPLVVDEIFTGFGRTGRMFAFEHEEGVKPDILVMAKSLAGGMPAGLVAASEALFSKLPVGAISSTFQLHPLSAAAGSAALKYTIEHDLVGRARTIATWFGDALNGYRNSSPVRAVRGIGAMFGLQIIDGNGNPDAVACKRIRRSCLRAGLITYECGYAGEVVGLMPPLVITHSEFDRGIKILNNALQEEINRQ